MKRMIIISVVATLILVGSIVVFIKCTTESPATNEDIMELPDLAPHAEDDGYEYLAKLEAEEEKDEEVTNEPAKEVAEADSADAPEETILEDPYGMYVVTEDWLKEYGGYVVERNGQLYAFYSQYGVMGDVPEKYGVGYELGGRGYNWTYLYYPDIQEVIDVPTNATGKIATSAGDFPIFEVSKNEEIRVYNKDVIDEITLFPANFYGYCINGTHIRGAYRPTIDFVAGDGMDDVERPDVCDMSGNPVADAYNLEYGQEYKYGWFEGTEYHEMNLLAGSKCYTINEERVQVSVELTKNGYAVMDVSGLAPGTYYWLNSVFEITE